MLHGNCENAARELNLSSQDHAASFHFWSAPWIRLEGNAPIAMLPTPLLLWTTAPIDSSTNLPKYWPKIILRVEQYSPQQNALQFRHGKCPDTFWGWLALKEKRLFGNWIDPPFFFGGWLLLQLQTKPTCQCEHTILLEFCTCDIEKSVHDGLNLLGWHIAITCLRDLCHDLFLR